MAPAAACVVLAVVAARAAALLPYEDAALPVAARAADLVSRMSVPEMVAQMLNPVGSSDGPGGFAVNAENIVSHYAATGLGTVYAGPSCATLSGAACHNWLQGTMINASRLHIPVSFIGETLVSGCNGATIFPQPVLRGASFDLGLEHEVATSIARQARAGGIDRGLSPVLQVDTDARFGVSRARAAWRRGPPVRAAWRSAVAPARVLLCAVLPAAYLRPPP